MKQKTNKFFAIFFAVLLLTITSNAQSKNEKIIAEITDLRQKAVTAIEKRDRQTLDKLFADEYTHTHAIGRVDDKKTRLDVFVSGDKTIDTAVAEDLKIKVFGDKTAVASGKSSVKSDDGTFPSYRWIVVYAKIGKKWQIVASQASKIEK